MTSVPVWLGRLLGGEAVASTFTRIRGAANDKAERELGWTPRYASWREGFREVLAPQPPPASQAAVLPRLLGGMRRKEHS